MKKSLLLLTFVVSGLSGMNHVDYQRLPKRELVRILQNQRTEPVIHNDVQREEIIPVVQERIIEVNKPSFISRHRNKIIGLGALGAAAGLLHVSKVIHEEHAELIDGDHEELEILIEEDQPEEIIPVIQEEIIEVSKPSFFSRHKKKLVGLGIIATLAATGYGGYHYFPEYYHNAYNHVLTGVGMIKTLIQSKFRPQDNVQICKTIQNRGFFNRLFNGNTYETCTKANNMSFKEIFNSIFA